MTNISPIYKRKVTKESFKKLADINIILKKIKDTYLANKQKDLNARSWAPQKIRLQLIKETDKCIT